jgi:hypothetical protein
MAGRAVEEDLDAARMHPQDRPLRLLARGAEGGIGAGARMRRLSPLVVVGSAGRTLVLVAGSVTGIGTGTEVGSGRRGIDVHHCLGENRRLREHLGVSGIARLGIDGRPLGLVHVPQHRAEGDR